MADNLGVRVPFSRRREDSTWSGSAEVTSPRRGVVSYWYLNMLFIEERYRAERYQRPLALLLAEPVGESESVQRHLRDWLYSRLRMTDVAGYLGARCFAILLPETDRAGANALADRLRGDVQGVRTDLGVYPDDGLTLENLIAAARRARGQEAEQAS